jgi:hypothetical protein
MPNVSAYVDEQRNERMMKNSLMGRVIKPYLLGLKSSCRRFDEWVGAWVA